MNISKEIKTKLVYPDLDGFKNVLKIVKWNVIFEEDDVQSIAAIQTEFDTSNLALDYIDLSSTSDEDIIKICLEKEGGQDFIDRLMFIHKPQMEKQKTLNQLEPYIE